jgi:hypothetical protein
MHVSATGEPLTPAMPNGVRSAGWPREIKLAASYFLVTPLLVPFGTGARDSSCA